MSQELSMLGLVCVHTYVRARKQAVCATTSAQAKGGDDETDTETCTAEKQKGGRNK